jgi:hypothetical protein
MEKWSLVLTLAALLAALLAVILVGRSYEILRTTLHDVLVFPPDQPPTEPGGGGPYSIT